MLRNQCLYSIGPNGLEPTQAKVLKPKFERAVRRLFRIYDRDRDGLLGDAELNNFQYRSFNLLLSEMDIVALKKVESGTAPRRVSYVAGAILPDAGIAVVSGNTEAWGTIRSKALPFVLCRAHESVAVTSDFVQSGSKTRATDTARGAGGASVGRE